MMEHEPIDWDAPFELVLGGPAKRVAILEGLGRFKNVIIVGSDIQRAHVVDDHGCNLDGQHVVENCETIPICALPVHELVFCLRNAIELGTQRWWPSLETINRWRAALGWDAITDSDIRHF